MENQRYLRVYFGSVDEKSPFVFTPVLLFDETLKLKQWFMCKLFKFQLIYSFSKKLLCFSGNVWQQFSPFDFSTSSSYPGKTNDYVHYQVHVHHSLYYIIKAVYMYLFLNNIQNRNIKKKIELLSNKIA